MTELLTKLLVKVLPIKAQRYLSLLKHYIFGSYSNRSYALEGEDIILDGLFNKNKGFYVDIGANHPFRHSNTYLFYKSGWQGINIDPIPGGMKIFDIARPRDTNLEYGVSSKKQKLTFFMFGDPVLNTFDESVALQRNKTGHKIIDKKIIETKTLKEIFDNHLAKKKIIDFLSVDAEGMDIDVLKSNDWSKYVPRVIIVESLNFVIDKAKDSDVYEYLVKKGYRLIANTKVNLIFAHKDFKVTKEIAISEDWSSSQ